jgi:PASTA domain
MATCFAPNATISVAPTVPVGESVLVSGNVQGGQDYGELSLAWSASAGKVISAGVSRANKPLYQFDSTGAAPGTNIAISLRVTSSKGSCIATAQTRVSVASPPTQNQAPTPLLIPDLVGQDLATARRRLNALEPKLQITTQPVNDGQAKPEEVVRQDPPAGEPLKPGQQVILYVAQAQTNATQTPAQACYGITLNEVVTNQDGEVSSPKWSFEIQADGKRIYALPAQPYSDRKTPNQGPDGSVTSFGIRGTWCGTAEQPFRLGVIGTNVGEKDPRQRPARGELVVKPTTAPYPINLSVRTPNPKDGDFTFRFTVRPANAATAK